jgi:hypothetical protein
MSLPSKVKQCDVESASGGRNQYCPSPTHSTESLPSTDENVDHIEQVAPTVGRNGFRYVFYSVDNNGNEIEESESERIFRETGKYSPEGILITRKARRVCTYISLLWSSNF